ncbi:MAG: hypothetical protein C0609_07105 [Deltaproteobacteria bacterium]|nr:MAG: hypothetical protein C0609_07105 [Deltaproteobacteria bacterium]
MYKLIKMAITLAAVSLVLAAPGFSSDAMAFKRTSVGDTVVNFELKDLDGKAYTLSDSIGEKATLVLFWAAWSPRSADFISDIQAMLDAHGDKGLKAMGVNVEHQELTKEDFANIRTVLTDTGATFPMVIDNGLEVFNAYGVAAVPSAVMIDNQGVALKLVTGYGTMAKYELKEYVEEYLGVAKKKEPLVKAPEGYTPKGKAIRYMRMAERMFEKHNSTKALRLVKQAVEEDPDYAEAYHLMGQIYDKLGKAEDAEAAEKKAVEIEGSRGSSVEVDMKDAITHSSFEVANSN